MQYVGVFADNKLLPGPMLNQWRCGVPQGSVLGPLLFALYINDIQYAVGAAGVRLFADHTALYMVNSDLQTLLSGIKDKNWKSLQMVYLQQTNN